MNRQRAKASLGLASTILKLKELLAEEFLRLSFIFKVNPDGVFVKTQNILYICLYGEPETLLHFFFSFFLPHCLFCFRRRVIYNRQENKDRNVP